MKKYFYGTAILAVLSVFGFYACNEAEPLKDMNNSTIKGSSIAMQVYYTRADLQSKTSDEIRVIFNAISAQNRYDLALDKLNHCLSLNPSNSQGTVINDLISELSVNSYVWGSTEHQNMITVFLPSKLSVLEQSFSNQEGLNTFYHFYDLDNLDDIVDGGGFGGDNDCGCNQGSIFGGCQVGQDNCDDINCGGSAHGCGFGWFYKCDGICDDVPTPSNESMLYH